MTKLYKYVGTVYSMTYPGKGGNVSPQVTELVLEDMNDNDKAPIKIDACCGLFIYLKQLQSTDAEERYLNAVWYYDSNFTLYRIEIPSNDPDRPAKIIATHEGIDIAVSIFGPEEYIETEKPAPVDDEQWCAWLAFHREDK